MKKFRNIISVILAAVMILGCTSVIASAAYPDKILTMWDDEYYYGGEMTVGENTVTANGSYSGDYFNFNAENEGYYLFRYDDEGSVYSVCLLEEYYSSYYEEVSGIVNNDGYALLYLENGENYIGVWFDSSADNSEKVSVEYAGKEITDINLIGGTEYPLILGYDVTDDGHNFADICGFDIIFDNENTVEFPEVTDSFEYHTADGGLKIGENDVEIEIEGKRFSKKFTVAYISDFIKKVEIADGEMSETVYYDGSIMGTGRFAFEITYTDGTVIKAYSGDRISLRNGNPYDYYIYSNCYNGEGNVQIGNNDLLSFTYESNQATFTENLGVFFSNIGYEFYYISRIPEKAQELFEQDSAADTLREFGEFVSFVNNNFFYAIGGIYEHIVMLFAAIS